MSKQKTSGTPRGTPGGAKPGSVPPAAPPPATEPKATAAPRTGWGARLAGLLLLGAAALLLARSLSSAYADYRFNTLAAPAESNPVAVRLAYADELRTLLRIDPGNSSIRVRLANTLTALGNHEAAIDELKRGLQTQRAQNGLDALAQMLERAGRSDEALAAVSQSKIMNPFGIDANQALLRLLNQRVDRLKIIKNPNAEERRQLAEARREFAEQATNWYIRAVADPNAHLFMGNFYVEPLISLQAYRCYLAGLGLLQQADPEHKYQLMIEPRSALGTITQILRGHYARPYRDLP